MWSTIPGGQPSTLAHWRLGEIGDQFHFAPAARDRIEHETRRDREHADDHQTRRQHRRRQPRHQTFLEIGDDDGNREIVACGFFDPADLPQDTTPGTRLRIAEVLGGKPLIATWR